MRMPVLKGDWEKWAREAAEACQRFWKVSSCEECMKKRLVQPCGFDELDIPHPSEQTVREE